MNPTAPARRPIGSSPTLWWLVLIGLTIVLVLLGAQTLQPSVPDPPGDRAVSSGSGASSPDGSTGTSLAEASILQLDRLPSATTTRLIQLSAEAAALLASGLDPLAARDQLTAMELTREHRIEPVALPDDVCLQLELGGRWWHLPSPTDDQLRSGRCPKG